MKVKQLNVCLLFAALAQQTLFAAVNANPSGASVVNGQVSFSQPDASTLQITNSPSAIINWQQFNIGAQQVTRFVQDNSASAVLNRVIGGNASELLGRLQSNGQVFLINPNGLVIGRDAVIDTAGFIGSTLNISDQDFLNGRLHFEGDNADGIDNQGYIYAGNNGDILLIAPNINNSGVLEVDGGNILLAAGRSITIASLDDANISFEVQAAADSVTNLGQVIANNGAANLFAGTLTHTGSVSANGITRDAAGNIRLVATDTNWIEGEVTATGNKGGDIHLLGAQVGLDGNALIDASGTSGGGQVLIGGDYQGQGEVQTARASFVGDGVQIKADALENGDGGRVIVWSDESTRMYGGISATGGALSGDGGFIETSGLFLDVGMNVPNVSSPLGEGGTWLLDPNNILIIAGTVDTLMTAATPFLSLDDGAEISVGTLIAALGNGDVEVWTSTGGLNNEAGDITWDSGATLDIAGIGTRTLTLNAHNDINFQGNIDIISTGVGNESLTLNINADFDGSGNGNFTQGTNSTISLAGFASGVGILNVNAPGNITIDGDINTGPNAGSQVNLTTTGGAINQLFAADNITTETLTTSSLGNTTLAGSNIVDIFTATSGGDIVFDNRAALRINGINATGGVFLAITDTISQGINIGEEIVAASLDITADGNVTLTNAANDVDVITTSTNSSGTSTLFFSYTDVDDLEIQDMDIHHQGVDPLRSAFLDITTGGDMTLNGNVNVSGGSTSGITLNAQNGSNIIHQSGTVTTDVISFQNDGDPATTGAVGSLTSPVQTSAFGSSISINLGTVPGVLPVNGGGDLFLLNTTGDLSLYDYVPANPSVLQIENTAGNIDLQSLSMVDAALNPTDLLTATSITLKASGDLFLTPSAFSGSRLVSTVGDIFLEGLNLTVDGGIDAAGDVVLVANNLSGGTLNILDTVNSTAGNVELHADAFNITSTVTAQNQVVVRELNAFGGLEINDATPTLLFARLTTADLGFLTGTTGGLLLGNDLASTTPKIVQLNSDIGSSVISGPTLTFDSTNNGGGSSTVVVAANIDFTAENENLIFTGNGSAFIEPIALTAPAGLLVDTGSGNLTANLPQFTILGSDNRQAVVRANNVDITGDLSVRSGNQAGSFASFEGNNLTVQGGFEVLANADSAQADFSNLVAIDSLTSVDLTGGSGTGAFANLLGGDILITSDSISLVSGAGVNAPAEIRSTVDVELQADSFDIDGVVVAQNQVVVRELNAFGGLEISDAVTPTSGFARLTTTDLASLTGTNAGIALGNNLASLTPKIIQLNSDIDSSMINGPNLLFDSTNNSSGISTVIVAANIDFTAENENLFFIGNGSAFIEPLALTAPSGLLVDTGTGDLTSNLPQFSILGLDDRQVVVRTNTANITGDLSVSSGDSAGSFAIFEGSNLTLQGGLAIVANADSAEVNFNNTVAINSPAFVDLSAGLGTDAFAKLTGGDINITSTSINLLGGQGANTIAEIRSTGDTVIDTSGAITLQGGTGSDADSVIAAGGGQGAVTLQYASCTACDNQLSSDPVGNGVSDSGIFARDLSLNGSIVVGTDPTPDPTPDPGSESSDPNPVPALDSLLANFQAGYITPVVPEGDDADEDRLSVCR